MPSIATTPMASGSEGRQAYRIQYVLTITDPAERASRLALAFALFEQGGTWNQGAADGGEASDPDHRPAADDDQPEADRQREFTPAEARAQAR